MENKEGGQNQMEWGNLSKEKNDYKGIGNMIEADMM